MNKKTLLGIILLFACTEKEETTIIHSHPNLPEPDFKLNLESDSGENLDYVTINWQNSDGEMTLKDEAGNIISITENYYLYDNLGPGTFKDVFFQLSLADTIYNDTMQIFTRTVFPITKFISIFDEVIEKNGYWDENEQFTDGNQIYDEGEEYEDGNDTYDFKDIDGDG